RIAAMGLADHVELLGALHQKELIQQLQMAHCFVLASYLENSPNSLCEAMRVGMPCVASYVGGIPSLIDVGKTALSFPAGDSALLAMNLRRIFEDDPLALRLGSAAMQEATRRHDPDRVVDELLASYRGVSSPAPEK
ncbi:MAG: glycosyltransferase family 4 protein, partial [Planctomycetota bacterium]